MEKIPLMKSQVFTQLYIDKIKNIFFNVCMFTSQINIMLLTLECAFDLGNCLCWGKPTVPFL